jgi:enterochelin esterase-like enzyme
MSGTKPFSHVSLKVRQIISASLGRDVRYDIYAPQTDLPADCPLLLVNDGQDLISMAFSSLIDALWSDDTLDPFLIVAIHAGKDRKMEYGTAGEPDYMGRGNRADKYRSFVMDELLPGLRREFPEIQKGPISLAGFSLGGLSAMDLAWHHPEIFRAAGVFSGSLWWRSLAQEDPSYSDNLHRIMHQRVRNSGGWSQQRFFFQCGAMDEQSDRNRNGIIDSIDDTLDLIEELVKKGVPRASHIYYLELADGRHDIESWARAFPFFLRWIYSK